MSDPVVSSTARFVPVILAGGSGTRFWPRSRKARAKQVLQLHGDGTMIQQTLERLLPVAAANDVWVITNSVLEATIAEQLPQLAAEHILSEPAARNTAPACALAAFLLETTDPNAVIGIFPSDHVVSNKERFAEVIQAGVNLAASGDRIVVLGVPPTRAETGYGYVEQGASVDPASVPCGDVPVRRVRRFTEKPDRQRAESFLRAGNYAWNGGIFLWSARTLAGAIRDFCPELVEPLSRIAAAQGTPEFARVFAEEYPRCTDISIDFAVLEPRSSRGEHASELYCLPADFGWNDLGSWAALHEQLAEGDAEELWQKNVLDGADEASITIDAGGNYVFAPGKIVAMIGVHNLVVVETADALLITTRDRSQDVGKIVGALKSAGRIDLI
jgi:mannose-1-phosphate guanylyltransferase